MARVAFPLVLQSPSSGSAIVGATATITQHVVGQSLGSGAPAAIYTAETGAGATTTNQITTDNLGRFTQGQTAGYAQYWLEEGTYDIAIGGSGLTSYVITREFVSGNPVIARAFLNASPIVGLGWQKLNLDTVTFDPAGAFDVATNHRFNCPVNGYYAAYAAVSVQYNQSGGSLQAGVGKNGSNPVGGGAQIYRGLNSADGLFASSLDIFQCAAGDYLDLRVFNGDPTNAMQVNGGGACYLAVARVL